ncbi:DUF4397 domain-containing protein [Metabacillus litoralis]|uniref:DUF4397 domain-containing protein n=1 Tax=Metabacillus litoralis TaxID=152268 RepID=UPI001CFDA09C|nr:DUF4397 domain-containing protein [Metabacillus litoralis]
MHFQDEQSLVLSAAKNEMLANFYKYTNPSLSMMYYQKHLMCIQQLAAADYRGYQENQMYTRAGEQNSFVRVLHTSPDAPAVDVYVNGQKVITDLTFKETTDYLRLPPGQYTIEVYPAGDMSQLVLQERVALTRNTYYTAAATGKLANISLDVFVDKPYVSPNQSKVRVIHLSPDAPNVDIAVKGGDVLFRNVPFKKATDYLTLSPMTVNLEVRVAGTNNVVLSIPQVQLKAGKTYTAVAVGLANGMPALDAIFLMS